MVQEKRHFSSRIQPQLLPNGSWDEKIFKSCTGSSHEQTRKGASGWPLEGNPAHCPLHIPTCGLPILSPRSAKGDHLSAGRPWGPVSVIDSGTLVHAGEVREASGASISMTWPLTLPPSFPASGLCFLDTSCHTGSCSLSLSRLLCWLELQDHGLQSFLHHLELPLERLCAHC